MIFLVFIALFGCKKQNSPVVTLTSTPTGCPLNSICSFTYYNSSDVSNTFQVTSGGYRVFAYQSIDSAICDATTTVYFKISPDVTSFDITSAQIASGQSAFYGFTCPCCDYLAQTIVGGEIKGKMTDNYQWLVNAKIILGAKNTTLRDTLVFNQYFHPPYSL